MSFVLPDNIVRDVLDLVGCETLYNCSHVSRMAVEELLLRQDRLFLCTPCTSKGWYLDANSVVSVSLKDARVTTLMISSPYSDYDYIDNWYEQFARVCGLFTKTLKKLHILPSSTTLFPLFYGIKMFDNHVLDLIRDCKSSYDILIGHCVTPKGIDLLRDILVDCKSRPRVIYVSRYLETEHLKFMTMSIIFEKPVSEKDWSGNGLYTPQQVELYKTLSTLLLACQSTTLFTF